MAKKGIFKFGKRHANAVERDVNISKEKFREVVTEYVTRQRGLFNHVLSDAELINLFEEAFTNEVHESVVQDLHELLDVIGGYVDSRLQKIVVGTDKAIPNYSFAQQLDKKISQELVAPKSSVTL